MTYELLEAKITFSLKGIKLALSLSQLLNLIE